MLVQPFDSGLYPWVDFEIIGVASIYDHSKNVGDAIIEVGQCSDCSGFPILVRENNLYSLQRLRYSFLRVCFHSTEIQVTLYHFRGGFTKPLNLIF